MHILAERLMKEWAKVHKELSPSNMEPTHKVPRHSAKCFVSSGLEKDIGGPMSVPIGKTTLI